MKRLLLPVLAASLLFVPTGASAADLVLRDLAITIGIGSPLPRIERQPQVIYVREEAPYYRQDNRHQQYKHQNKHQNKHQKNRRNRHWHEEPRVVIIDDHRRSYGSERVVVTRPGTVVVVANDRRR
ncbi:MAG: hypothetical protein IH614_15645 [Desulfuromonadales bacterium]|nr:hypothetical protein [Desulfuromonadales bacterium]